MLKAKKCEVLSGNQECTIETIIKILLENRGLKTQKEIDAFLHPKLEDVTVESVGIDKKELEKTLQRIQKAIYPYCAEDD